MKKNYGNNILKRKNIIMNKKKIKIKEICEISFPFCIYDSEK